MLEFPIAFEIIPENDILFSSKENPQKFPFYVETFTFVSQMKKDTNERFK